jgi:dTDP-4-amino-4,6-dideoxygalactose transaminase
VTAEGGCVCLNLPEPFDNEAIYKYLCIKTLHGQTKDALAKTQKGAWRYDIIEAGYKCNMTDLAAAIGLIEIDRYDKDTLVRRREIFDRYAAAFIKDPRFTLPIYSKANKTSCYHLYPLRLKGATEEQRDAVIKEIFEHDVSVNVHFMPVPCMTFYKNLGYDIKNYPVAYKNYSQEISLPVFYDLNNEMTETVIKAVLDSVNKVLG